MSFDGDIAALGRIAASLESLRDIPRVAEGIAADRLEQLIQLEFDAGVDPYGVAWTPLSDATLAYGRHDPPLTDTREMRDSLLIYPSQSDGLRMTIGTEDHPAGPHQDSWSGPQGDGPARPIFPTGDMPDSWSNAIEDATVDAITQKLSEGRSA